MVDAAFLRVLHQQSLPNVQLDTVQKHLFCREACLTLAVLLCSGIKLTTELKASTPGAGKMKDYTKYLNEQKDSGKIKELADEVAHFASGFPMPGL